MNFMFIGKKSEQIIQSTNKDKKNIGTDENKTEDEKKALITGLNLIVGTLIVIILIPLLYTFF